MNFAQWLKYSIVSWTVTTALLQNVVRSGYIYIEDKQTYQQAERVCRDLFNGSVAGLRDNKEGMQTCLEGKDEALWSGHQIDTSPWINILGCFRNEGQLHILRENKMADVGNSWIDNVTSCFETCYADTGNRYFATMDGNCICILSMESLSKVDSEECIRAIDGDLEQTRNRSYIVYETVTPGFTEEPESQALGCLGVMCDASRQSFLPVKCKGDSMQMLCENQQKSVTNGTFLDGMKDCWNMSLLPQKYDNETVKCNNGSYRIGVFRRSIEFKTDYRGNEFCQTMHFDGHSWHSILKNCTKRYQYICRGRHDNTTAQEQGTGAVSYKICSNDTTGNTNLTMTSEITLTTSKDVSTQRMTVTAEVIPSVSTVVTSRNTTDEATVNATSFNTYGETETKRKSKEPGAAILGGIAATMIVILVVLAVCIKRRRTKLSIKERQSTIRRLSECTRKRSQQTDVSALSEHPSMHTFPSCQDNRLLQVTKSDEKVQNVCIDFHNVADTNTIVEPTEKASTTQSDVLNIDMNGEPTIRASTTYSDDLNIDMNVEPTEKASTTHSDVLNIDMNVEPTAKASTTHSDVLNIDMNIEPTEKASTTHSDVLNIDKNVEPNEKVSTTHRDVPK